MHSVDNKTTQRTTCPMFDPALLASAYDNVPLAPDSPMNMRSRNFQPSPVNGPIALTKRILAAKLEINIMRDVWKELLSM